MSADVMDPSFRSSVPVWCRAEMYSSSCKSAVEPIGFVNFIFFLCCGLSCDVQDLQSRGDFSSLEEAMIN